MDARPFGTGLGIGTEVELGRELKQTQARTRKWAVLGQVRNELQYQARELAKLGAMNQKIVAENRELTAEVRPRPSRL